jgi:signal transduction histidine kinase
MTRPTRWRLSKRLLWGFTLLSALPILVVGFGTRYYMRSLLDRAFEQRVELTRRLVSTFNAELEARVRHAQELLRARPELQDIPPRADLDRSGIGRLLDSLAGTAQVSGIDLARREEGGWMLVARSGRPTHFGFPVQVAPPASELSSWPSPELEAYCYGTSMPSADGRHSLVVYHLITPDLLAPFAEAGTFWVGSRTVDDAPLTVGTVQVSAWPVWDSPPDELIQMSVGGHAYAVGKVGPFFYGMPRDDNLAALQRLDLFLLVVVLVAIAVAVFAARRVALSAARPVEELADAVGKWGRGEEPEPLITFAEGETATLVNAFEHLRGELSAAERRLADAARSAGWQEMARKVAHEIKNPLTPIRVTMEDLARQVERDPQRAVAMIPEATRLVAEEVTVLRRIVDAFARFARLPEPQPVPVDLNQVVTAAVNLHQKDAGARLRFVPAPSPMTITLDPQLFGEALTNLLKNALEAAGPNGAVNVLVRSADGGCTIEIEDSGPGFPEDLLKHGPRPYFTTKRGGTGLGLVISQRIITDAGGELTLSNTSTGAKATITLKAG